MKKFMITCAAALALASCGDDGYSYKKCLESCDKKYLACCAASANPGLDPTTQLVGFILCSNRHEKCNSGCRRQEYDDWDFLIYL